MRKDFLFSESSPFILDLYDRYKRDPESVPYSWRNFFEGSNENLFETETKINFGLPKDISVEESLRAFSLIQSYREKGHLIADLDPLHLEERSEIEYLDPKRWGFKDEDLDRPIFLNGVLGYENASLKTLIGKLREIYCGSLGIEFMHITNPHHREWILNRLEGGAFLGTLSSKDSISLWKELLDVETFESFLDVKYKGAKRFGLEGCDSVVPCLKEALRISSKFGVQDFILGMAHRGRLNVLANVLGKPVERIFKEFSKSNRLSDTTPGSGDVKYHLGYSGSFLIDEREINISLTPNPSHLEAVNSVVLGKVRALQDFLGNDESFRVMGVLIHGDASFPGQGVVAESLGLSRLEGYQTGGTLHIIANNQIGFTTSPKSARSFPYASDFAKAIEAPIFHVNADDPEAVILATRMACEFRHIFQKDVVLDIIGYRRLGHNEGDDPSFTQPCMYEKIRSHRPVRQKYQETLLNRKELDQAIIDHWTKERRNFLDTAHTRSDSLGFPDPDWMTGQWSSYEIGSLQEVDSDTSIDELKILLKSLLERPKDFVPNKKMDRLLGAKEAMVNDKEGIDWATAESLAFATILEKGFPIRLSGQDCCRGTFSQRHVVWIDQETGNSYIPLNNLGKKQDKLEVFNSPLSEFSVLGYEYGYSLSSPRSLVIWEAQFGDFSNGAQVIIDQFISSGESKWQRLSGLVMLLPHGYEGQGPEHSSARLERYLQLCAENNMHVAYCSTPANYYHILRRQILGPFRKPLVLMTPKSLLRNPLAVSQFEDMSKGTHFLPVIAEKDPTIHNPRRLVLCSGKIYYDLLRWRTEANIKDVALVRLEELYPFPEQDLIQEFKKHKEAEVFWCQEEPENMGAWGFLDRRLERAMSCASMKHTRAVYVGRKASASPATGFLSVHEDEQMVILKTAFSRG